MENKPLYSAPSALVARGIKIKLKDLDEVYDPDDLKPYAPTKLTNYEIGVQGEKSIVVPSFGTTSVLFVRHFQTLR